MMATTTTSLQCDQCLAHEDDVTLTPYPRLMQSPTNFEDGEYVTEWLCAACVTWLTDTARPWEVPVLDDRRSLDHWD